MSNVGLQRVVQCVTETHFDGVLNAANFLDKELCESVTQFCAVIDRSDVARLRQVQDVADCRPAPAWVGCGSLYTIIVEMTSGLDDGLVGSSARFPVGNIIGDRAS